MGAPQAAGPSFLQASGLHSSAFFDSTQTTLFTLNGKLYCIQKTDDTGGAGIDGIGVYKSTDGGTTWAQVDAANAPVGSLGAATFDAPNNRLVLALVGQTFPPTAQSIFLKNFNLQTETWGANYATGGPNAVTTVQQVFVRPDTTILAVYDLGAGPPGGTTRLRGAYWNGTVWSASIDLGANTIGIDATGNVAVTNTGAAMDSSGNVHLAFTNAARSYTFYQQFTAANALGSSHQFVGISFNTSVSVIGSVVISGSNVLISTTTNAFVNQTILSGTPLAAPAWSTISPAALSSAGGLINLPGPLATDGTHLIWMVNFTDPTLTYNYYQIAKSTDNGATWALLSDNGTAPFFYDFAPGQSAQAPNADATFGALAPSLALLSPAGEATAYGFVDVQNTLFAEFCGYFMNSEAIAPAPPSTPTKLEISLFGVKRWAKEPESPCVEAPEPTHVKRAV